MSYTPKGQARLEVHVPIQVKKWLKKKAQEGRTSVSLLVSAILGHKMQKTQRPRGD